MTLDEIKSSDPDACRAGPFGSSISRKYFVSAGVPVIRGNNLTTDLTDFIAEGFVFVSEERAHTKYRGCLARPGDLVLTCWGTIGQVGHIPENGPFDEYVISNKQLKLRTDPHIADSKFVYYYVASKAGVEYIQSRSIGAAVPGINLGILKSIPIALPPIPQQQTIVGVLSAYDDLIENNRRRIQLLEAAARLLYQEWFVHLRFPGHEHVTITDGVPEGWDRGVVSDFYQTASGGTPSRKKPEYFAGEIPWVKTQELPNGFVLDTEEHITEEAVSNSSAKVFPRDTLLLALYGATIGELGILSTDATCNQACCAIMPKDERAHIIHAYLFFRENKKNLVALSGGAAQNNISQQIVRAFPMTMPASTVAEIFVEAMQPLFNQWLNLEQQNRRLRTARDILLPRLMNGELPV